MNENAKDMNIREKIIEQIYTVECTQRYSNHVKCRQSALNDRQLLNKQTIAISRTQIFQQLRRAKTKSSLFGKLGWNRKSPPFPDATKVLAIVAEKCYQKTCKLTNNQTGMARTIFMLFVGPNLIKICVVSLQLAILTKISQKAAHAFRQR